MSAWWVKWVVLLVVLAGLAIGVRIWEERLREEGRVEKAAELQPQLDKAKAVNAQFEVDLAALRAAYVDQTTAMGKLAANSAAAKTRTAAALAELQPELQWAQDEVALLRAQAQAKPLNITPSADAAAADAILRKVARQVLGLSP